MKYSKQVQEAAHNLIAKLQDEFGIKDTMFPIDEQLFDNLVWEAFRNFEKAIKPPVKLIEVDGCNLSIDQITLIQFDNKEQLKNPQNPTGLRCRIMIDGNVVPLYGKNAVKIKNFCQVYQFPFESF